MSGRMFGAVLISWSKSAMSDRVSTASKIVWTNGGLPRDE